MKRKKVYKAIDSEREYQDRETLNDDRPDMLPEFNLGQALTAIDIILTQAKAKWYNDYPPYEDTMPLLRKIAGVCVKMGEMYGMPNRDV